jgi:hypothetical protein
MLDDDIRCRSVDLFIDKALTERPSVWCVGVTLDDVTTTNRFSSGQTSTAFPAQ